MITETPPVEAALNELRAELGDERVDLAELVITGARSKARRLGRADLSARRGRGRLAAMVRARSLPLDLEAADAVKRVRLPGPG